MIKGSDDVLQIAKQLKIIDESKSNQQSKLLISEDDQDYEIRQFHKRPLAAEQEIISELTEEALQTTDLRFSHVLSGAKRILKRETIDGFEKESHLLLKDKFEEKEKVSELLTGLPSDWPFVSNYSSTKTN